MSAPPGAGKTTVVPLALLDEPWRGDGRILVLEPRRLAARAAARRMAALVGGAVGDLVGFQTRDERRIGPATRIEVLTEGILTRRLQRDQSLDGVAAVLFDEVHERNLTTDLGLAFTLDAAAALRPDLRIVAMSATADTARFARLLGGDEPAPIVASEGRTFPIDIRWLPGTPQRRGGGRHGRGRPSGRPSFAQIVDDTSAAVRRALADETGDVLVFLPGIGEINATRERLVGAVGGDVDVYPLAGSISVAEQDRALEPSPPGRRRVVLSTDIAETSLTVDGVRVVVDSGVGRAPRFDSGTGMTRLTTVAISRDSADQRAGRAGRVEPGVCYRLWSRIEHGTRLAHREAELLHADLADVALEVAAWGTPVAELPLPDQPPRRTWEHAGELLRMLDAIDDDGSITALGRRMVDLPLHPRLAHLVAVSPTTAACVVAAVIDERDVMRGRPRELPADLELRVAAVGGRRSDDRIDRRAAARVSDRAADIARRAGVRFDLDEVDPGRTGLLLVGAFPDRLAGRRRGGQFQLRTGGRVWVPDDDPLASAEFIVAAELDGKREGAQVLRGAAVEAWEIAGLLDDVVVDEMLVWDTDRDDLIVRRTRRLDALHLGEEIDRPQPGPAATAALVARVVDTRLDALRWTPAARQLQGRVAVLRAELGDEWPDLTDEALVATVDEWLVPLLATATGAADLGAIDVAGALRLAVGWPRNHQLDDLAPESFTTPGGRAVPIDYTASAPTVSVRVQDVFGLTEHPRIVGDRVALTMELLSPADRPLQVTADLPGFWAGSWTDVRKDLAGRYPKHSWPTDPASAEPKRLKGR